MIEPISPSVCRNVMATLSIGFEWHDTSPGQ
jgi:hypothetical protein